MTLSLIPILFARLMAWLADKARALSGKKQLRQPPVYPSLRLHGLGIDLPVRVISRAQGLRGLKHKTALTIHWREISSWHVTKGSDSLPAEHVITLDKGRRRIHVDRREIGRLEREILVFARHHVDCSIEFRNVA